MVYSMSHYQVPTGAILPFAGTVAPSGYLFCNGAAVSRTTYAKLFAVIGVSHGYGDNSTTFNIPDYRGRFLRGVDGGTARDPNRATRTAMNTGGNTGDAVGTLQGQATAKNGLTATSSDSGHAHPQREATGSGIVGLEMQRTLQQVDILAFKQILIPLLVMQIFRQQ